MRRKAQPSSAPALTPLESQDGEAADSFVRLVEPGTCRKVRPGLFF